LNDGWTPAYLTGGPTNLYKDIDVALKGEEWRQPGLVTLAAKLATSAGEHKPIKVEVPTSYEPKAGANPWAEADGAACTGSRAGPDAWFERRGSRNSSGAAAAMVAPPPRPAPLPPDSAGAIELTSMPEAVPVPSTTSGSGTAEAPPPAAAMSNPVTDFLSQRLNVMLAPSSASAPLDA